MYCFSKICRICLNAYATEFINLHNTDDDDVQIYEKLKYCFPEIVNDKNLPENICYECYKFLEQMYNFKLMYIENTSIFYEYLKEISHGCSSSNNIKTDLYIDLNKPIPIKPKIKTEEEDTVNQSEDENSVVSMFSTSLNQWDLFETKFNCRCVKEYTENTEHLCKNCEGELLGFRLSKIKVGNAENCVKNELVSDDSNSNYSQPDDEETSKTYEKGFDYNDFLLNKVHANGMNKQMHDLQEFIQENEDDGETEENLSESSFEITPTKKNKIFKCSLCDKTYTRRYNLHNHYIKHNRELYNCTFCKFKYTSKEDLLKHEKRHRKFSEQIIEVNPDVPNLSSDEENNYSQLEVENYDEDENNYFADNYDDDDDDNDNNDNEVDDETEKTYSNSSNDNLNCSTCDKTFQNKSQLGIHLMTHFARKEYQCTICSEEFTDKSNLNDHMKQHPKRFACDECEKSYNFLSNLRRHQRIHNPNKVLRRRLYDSNNQIRQKKFPCNLCERSYDFVSNLKRHQFKNHPNSGVVIKKRKVLNLFKCEICNRIYHLQASLARHQKMKGHIVEKPDKAYKCDKCDKSYNFKSNLYRHKISHEGKYSCSICKEKFTEKEVLETHIFTTHTQIKAEKLPCSSCDELFSDNEALNEHKQLIHPKVSKNIEKEIKITNKRMYTCTFCRKSFKYLENLKMHSISHDREKSEKAALHPDKHYCHLCDRFYSKTTSMRKHFLTHTTGKIRKCNICHEVFRNRFLFIEHVRSHAEKLHYCQVCNRGYMGKSNLIRHIAISHKHKT